MEGEKSSENVKQIIIVKIHSYRKRNEYYRKHYERRAKRDDRSPSRNVNIRYAAKSAGESYAECKLFMRENFIRRAVGEFVQNYIQNQKDCKHKKVNIRSESRGCGSRRINKRQRDH